jgi:cytochrome c oxidase subunit IV
MGHSHSEPHISPLSTYYTVFAALIVLTFVTVGVSHLGLPSTLSIVVAVAVACVKATLVCAWFMHLLHDTKFNLLLFLAAFWFIGVFFIFTCFDLMSRDRVMKSSDSFEYRKDSVEDIIMEK